MKQIQMVELPKRYSYDGKEMSVMSAKMIWSEDTEPVTYIHIAIKNKRMGIY